MRKILIILCILSVLMFVSCQNVNQIPTTTSTIPLSPCQQDAKILMDKHVRVMIYINTPHHIFFPYACMVIEETPIVNGRLPAYMEFSANHNPTYHYDNTECHLGTNKGEYTDHIYVVRNVSRHTDDSGLIVDDTYQMILDFKTTGGTVQTTDYDLTLARLVNVVCK